MSSQSTGPRLGASSEKLEQCPYDACHWIRPTKLDDHVSKCRLNHQENLAEKGERPIWLTCLYNYRHQVVDVEYKFHAGRCPDRKKLWSYQLRAGELKKLFPEMLTISGEDLPPEKGERLEMYGGLDEGKLWCSELGRLINLKDVRKDANQIAQEAAEEKGRLLAEEVETEWKEKKDKVAPPPPPQPAPLPEIYKTRYTQEEIDYWNAPGTSKTPFSWMLHNSNPQGYVSNYPPGLTKKQRREFDVRNSIEFEKQMEAKKKAEAAKEADQAAKEAEEAAQELEKEEDTATETEETSVEKAEEGKTNF